MCTAKGSPHLDEDRSETPWEPVKNVCFPISVIHGEATTMQLTSSQSEARLCQIPVQYSFFWVVLKGHPNRTPPPRRFPYSSPFFCSGSSNFTTFWDTRAIHTCRIQFETRIGRPEAPLLQQPLAHFKGAARGLEIHRSTSQSETRSASIPRAKMARNNCGWSMLCCGSKT